MSEKYRPFPSIARFPGETGDELPTEATSVLAASPESMQISDLLTRSMFGSSAEKTESLFELKKLTKDPQMTSEAFTQLSHRASSARTPSRLEIYRDLFDKFRPLTCLPSYEDKSNPEARIAQESASSPSPYQEILETFSLPEDISDMKILDLGAGCSDFTAYALSKGADAYAVDPRYVNRHGLITSVKDGYTSTPESRQRFQEAISNFEKSLRENPLRYQAAMASDLPFEDDSFDLIVSQYFMVSYLNLNLDALRSGITESLRVLRDNGRLSLFPFVTRNLGKEKAKEDNPENILKMNNNRMLLTFLREQEKPYNITPITEISGKIWNRLDIFHSEF